MRPASSASSSPYYAAAGIINALWFPSSDGGHASAKRSLKSLVYDAAGGMRCSKAAYAQVCHVLQHRAQLQYMLESTRLVGRVGSRQKAQIQNPGLAFLLAYELVLGPKRALVGGGAVKRLVVEHEDALRRAAEDWDRKHPSHDTAAGSSHGGGGHDHPRYLRVNTLRATAEEVVPRIQSVLARDPPTTQSSAKINSNAESDDVAPAVCLDRHVPDLLVVPPAATGALIQAFQATQDATAVVWQDKSSCFSALCVAEGWDRKMVEANEDESCGGDYLDACAAPGNKTLHLAALLDRRARRRSQAGSGTEPPSTTIYALDRSKERCRVLQRRVRQHCGAEDNHLVRIVPQQQDCLATAPRDYPTVRCVMLDPTCSGSGVVSRQQYRDEDGASPAEDDADGNHGQEERLAHLSNFQVACLRHFMAFPRVDRIVYSTCSTHVAENEAAVARALAECPDWAVHAPVCLSDWPRRGVAAEGLTAAQTDAMVRVDPHEDATNGFFVCCLERRKNKKALGAMKGKQRTKQTPSDNIKEEIQKQQKVLKIPFYSNQYARKQPDESYHEDFAQRSSGSESQKPRTPKPPAKSPQKVASSKIAKKLKWKQQQHEAKQRRLEQKQKSNVNKSK